MTLNEYKNKIKKIGKIQETKVHAIPCFSAGIICGPHRGSFAVRVHLRSNLGIISGLGIICGAVQITQGEKPETSTKTCNETMLRDKLRVFVCRISPP